MQETGIPGTDLTADTTFIDIDGLCRLLKICRQTAWTLVQNCEIEAVKIGGKFMIPKYAVTDYIRRRKVQPRGVGRPRKGESTIGK